MIEDCLERPITKMVALIAHDAMRLDLPAWIESNRSTLSEHPLYATDATGRLLSDNTGLTIDQ